MKVIILGAGVSGLSAGFKLANNNKNVLIIEKDNQVGGLSKTIKFNSCLFDLGGHRFLTEKENIENFVKDLIGDDLLTIERKSKIYFRGNLIDYPIKPISAAFALGFLESLKSLIDYFISRKSIRKVINLEDWLIKSYGGVLFKNYFQEYTEKVWGISAREMSTDWSEARIGDSSLWKTIRDSFKKDNKLKTLSSNFYYPKKGIGMITDQLKKCIDKKGQVLMSTEIISIQTEKDKIKSVTVKLSNNKIEVLSGDYFVSTVPLSTLINKIDNVPGVLKNEASKLSHRSLIILFLEINKLTITSDSWIYFHSKKIPFARIHEPKNWSTEMVNSSNKTSLVLEIFCSFNDYTWQESESVLFDKCIESLENLGFLKKQEIINHKFIKISYAYPVYFLGYKEILQNINQYLSRYNNFQAIGRMGSFNYNFIDSALEQGFKAADKILKSKSISHETM